MLLQYWTQILEKLKEGICITDVNGVICGLNQRHAEHSSMTYEEMLGKCVLDWVPSKMDLVLNPQVIATGEPVTTVRTLGDGRRIVMEGNPIFDAEGNTVYCVTFSRDITLMNNLTQQMLLEKNMLGGFQKLVRDGKKNDLSSGPPRLFSSSVLSKMHRQISSIAETDALILLLGETGAGKDVFAQSIHQLSDRRDKPFVKVDCGSISESLIETELFGYAPGTFSGANKGGKVGLLEASAGGTLYLDEIGELPLSMQVRLLRFLQDKEFVRVGAVSPQKVDTRVIAATNRDLEAAVQRGEFRKDLYFRLRVVVLHIPPLRERRDDIIPLARMFLNYHSTAYHRTMSLSKEVEKRFLDYDWPGNVRELENLVQGVVVTCERNQVMVDDLPFALKAQNGNAAFTPDIHLGGKSYKEVMRDLEARMLAAGLERYGTLTKMAQNMLIDRSTLFRKVKELEKHGIFLLPAAAAHKP